MGEQWKDIKGYEGVYMVSSYGRILSVKKNRLLVLTPDKNGYLVVGLQKDNYRKTCKVHRLVAEAFLEKEEGKNIINHKDEVKMHNHVSNLEWCDIKYNNTYMDRQKKINARKRKALVGIDMNGTVFHYASVIEAGKKTKQSRRNIQQCLSGNQKYAGGYKWFPLEQWEKMHGEKRNSN